jgi:[ribosomal protein S5]-alanine N-acetyltransferase
MQPTVATERLLLRPFQMSDAKEVQTLANDIRVSESTANVPYPYTLGDAESWIGSHQSNFESRSSVVFAISLVSRGHIVGTVALNQISAFHRRANLGYWMGFPYWSKGFCTEAAKALIQYGNKEFEITRFDCSCLARNLGSARVMEKVGFKYEGRLVQYLNHKGKFEDILMHGLTLPERNKAAPNE